MARYTVETVRSLLEAVLDDLDDAEQLFRLRTALQLLVALEAQSDLAGATLEGADLDPEVRDRLDELDDLD